VSKLVTDHPEKSIEAAVKQSGDDPDLSGRWVRVGHVTLPATRP
jgi:hypothetical protein